MDLASCILGLKSVTEDAAVKDTWAADHLSLAYEAWGDAFCRLAGDRSPKPEFDPTDGVAVPGDGSSQCLMVSSVPATPRYMQQPMALPESILSQLPPESIKMMEQMQQQAQEQMAEMAQTDEEERDAQNKVVSLHLKILKAIKQTFVENPPNNGEDASTYIRRMETEIKESQGFSDCKLGSSSAAIPAGLGHGMPEIVLTAAKAHAKSHEESVPKQGSDLAKWLKNAKNYQQAEMAALDEQIRVLDNWCMMHGCASRIEHADE